MKTLLPRAIQSLAVLALAALGLLHVLVTLTPVLNWWTRALRGEWNNPTGEILVVLGGDDVEGEFLGRSSYWRAVSAVHAWREGKFQRVLICGLGVAPSMKKLMVLEGVPELAIETEERSRRTRENAEFSAERLRKSAGPVVLMTSEYHMFRAVRAFKGAGVEVLPRPAPDIGKQLLRWTERWSAFLRLSEETVKIAYYVGRGWLS